MFQQSSKVSLRVFLGIPASSSPKISLKFLPGIVSKKILVIFCAILEEEDCKNFSKNSHENT